MGDFWADEDVDPLELGSALVVMAVLVVATLLHDGAGFKISGSELLANS